MSNEQKMREALRIAVNYIDMDALYTFAGGDHDTIKEALATTEPAVNQQLTTEPVDEREAFEKWAAPNRFDVGHKGEDGSYLGLATGIAWAAWQARAAMAQGVRG